jgi:hypothetical protein
MDVHEHVGVLRRGLDAVLPDALLPSDGGLLLVVGGVLGLIVGLLVAYFSKAFDKRARTPEDVPLDAQELPVTAGDAEAGEDAAPVPVAPVLPTATADEQRAGHAAAGLELSPLDATERPIVVRPDPPKPPSRFAPDPSIFTRVVAPSSAAATAPADGAPGRPGESAPTGTVVDTVSVRIRKDAKEAATIPPPIRRILPAPAPANLTAVPRLVPEPSPEPVPEPESTAGAGSLLGEIGGLPRVEVRAARRAAITDPVPTPERRARESYELRARELERVAHDRLMREQKRLAVSIREQLAHDKRELEAVLDNRIEDTVLRPIELPVRRTAEPRSSGSRERESR